MLFWAILSWNNFSIFVGMDVFALIFILKNLILTQATARQCQPLALFWTFTFFHYITENNPEFQAKCSSEVPGWVFSTSAQAWLGKLLSLHKKSIQFERDARIFLDPNKPPSFFPLSALKRWMLWIDISGLHTKYLKGKNIKNCARKWVNTTSIKKECITVIYYFPFYLGFAIMQWEVLQGSR